MNPKKETLFKIFVFCFFISVGLNAQVNDVPIYLTHQFLRHNDPQSISMGTTGSSFKTGLMSGYLNPAGLSGLRGYDFAFSYYPSARFLGDMWDQYGVSVGASLPYGFKSAFYFTYANLGKELDGGISKYQLSLARQIYHFSLGGSVRYYRERWSVENGISGSRDDGIYHGLFFDLGIRSDWKVLHTESTRISVNFGAVYCNLGPDMNYEISGVDNNLQEITIKGKEPHARVIQAGFAVKAELFKHIDNPVKPEILIAVENRRIINHKDFSKWNYIISGAELLLYKSVFGRIGYSHKISTDYDYSGWTYGIGFRTPDNLSDNIPVSLGLSYSRGNSIGILNRNLVSVELTYNP